MKYALLKPAPVHKPSKAEVRIFVNTLPGTLRAYLSKIPLGEEIAVDTETCGTQAASPETYPVGVGVAWMRGTFYVDLPSQSPETLQVLADFLTRDDLVLIGHNVFFDGAILQAALGKWLNWGWDTYGLFRQLASEGWPGQRYGLKQAQLDLLLWDERGDVELDHWLVSSGNYLGNRRLDNTPEVLIAAYEEGKLRPDKSKMYLAPPNILGYYCGLDASSTYKLYNHIMWPAIQTLPEVAQQVFVDYHKTFITNVKLLVDQQLRGILIDSQNLNDFDVKLAAEVVRLEADFRSHPEVIYHLGQWREARLMEFRSTEPARHKKLPKLGEAPPELTKAGKPSKSYAAWLVKKAKIEELGPGEVSQNWLNWEARYNEMLKTTKFNLGSADQRRWLFYDRLRKPEIILTKKGKPATDKKALPGFGPAGRLLNKLDRQTKLQTFVASLRSRMVGDYLHPQFNTPGTFTGRLGGSGKFNLQNIPKSAAFTRSFLARPGHVWVDLDFTSLENYVLAELSRDSSLLKLYGPDAAENDAYLFNGSQLPVIGPKIRATGYDPYAPTPDAIARAKSEAKKERSVAKVITLASNYGAGAKKIAATLDLEGIRISMQEAYQLHAGFWRLYSGIKEYEEWLNEEWERRGGWVFNGVGRPICCFVDKRKDLVNRVVQSTGHDILMLFIAHIDLLVNKYQLEAYPVFLDTHDATCWETKEENGPRLKEIFEEALELMNQELMGTHGLIKLKGEAMIVTNLAEAKGLKDD